MKSKNRLTRRRRGFALIVTLSLMILLTVIAVGLLSLSSISLRSTGTGEAMARARANARLALMLAIGDMQKAAGPDKAITAPANLANDDAPAGLMGVWKSWRPPNENPDYQKKSAANFLGYMMSGSNTETTPNPTNLPSTQSGPSDLVSRKLVLNSVDSKTDAKAPIYAPVVAVASKTKSPSGGLAWVTMDEGVKGRIDLMPGQVPSGLAENITRLGAPPRNGFQTVVKMDFLKKKDEELATILPKLVSLNQVNLQADAKDATARYFNDFTVSSNSLQVDVANGGLKTDLSVLFDTPSVPSPTTAPAALPGEYGTRYLYSDTNAPFKGVAFNADVRWDVLANYARLYRRTAGNDNPTAGLKAAYPFGYKMKGVNDSSLKASRFEPDVTALKTPVLMPTVLRVDTIFGIVAHGSHHGDANVKASYPYMLFLTYLPVITLHNPYNVTLRVSGLQVEFADIPIGFQFLVNNQPTTTSGLMALNTLYSSHGNAKKSFKMQLSNNYTGAAEVVMGPGETRLFGTPFSPDSTWTKELAANGGTAGMMFDWNSIQTGNQADGTTTPAFTMPGLCTPSDIAVGYHVDWLAPDNRSTWLTGRIPNDGVAVVKSDDTIKVVYGPKISPTAASGSPAVGTTTPAVPPNTFSITLRMGANAQEVARTQVFYLNDSRLTTIVKEGQSLRFKEARNFPATYPASTESGLTVNGANGILEVNDQPIKKYSKSRPFAVFSVSAKTTTESFTASRPVADTGVAFQMATCDLRASTASSGSSPLEFALVPVKQGQNAIESGGLLVNKTSTQAFFFGGHGSQRGTNNATIYEIPKAPLQSIAQLRHANIGSIGSAPYVTYTIGESRAHPAVPSDASFLVDNSRLVLDRSWLANDQLWDKYWFSTLSTLQGLTYSGSSSSTQDQLASDFFSGVKKLPNVRNTPYLSGTTAADASAAARTVGGAQSAAYMMTQGGFNVNSTSVAAWTSILSSMMGSSVPIVTATNNDVDKDAAPYGRMRQPVLPTGTADAKNKLWNGYRTLDSGQIQDLAEKIVAEVKARGPFLSMSEFVNRRLGAPGPLTNNGAIQAAIDNTNINDIMTKTNALDISPADVKTFGWKNADAVTKNTGAGAPGEVSQGDVLSAIGSFVTVRSDTFRIRASGDARDASGNIVARAWCEAVIQRVPGYVDPTDRPEVIPTVPTNVTFGRRFEMVSFHWLNEQEI